MSFDKDAYRTPKYFRNWVVRRFSCNIDGCATEENKILRYWIGRKKEDSDISHRNIAEDFLDENLTEALFDFEFTHGHPGWTKIFINPPYSNPLPFVERAAELKEQGYLVVMLLPADKSTKWYKVIQDNATEVIDIVGGRINFLHPTTGEEVKGNNKGSMVAVFDPTMQGFATRQVSLDFVKKVGGY